jgi:tripartite-type tricarboxylate transporter receptor subunit TctC
MRKVSFVALPVAALCGVALAGVASAQEWPARPITIVVPYSAGSPADVIARLLGQHMGETLGQQFVVENLAGAGGLTGTNRVAKAAPDGYQIVQGGTGTHALSQWLYKNPPYNATTDFAPLGLVVESPLVLIARKDLPANTLAEFIAYAKQHPTTFGSAGVGSATHLGCELLTQAAGFKATHVPYRGMGQAAQDLTAGRIDFGCDFVLGALPQIQGGNLKGIAILSKDRAQVLPALPTAQEQGLPGFEAYNWTAMFLPKGTPDPIVRKLNTALNRALDAPLMRERLAKLGAVIPAPERRTPEYLDGFVKSEVEKWAAPIKASGATVE